MSKQNYMTHSSIFNGSRSFDTTGPYNYKKATSLTNPIFDNSVFFRKKRSNF